MMPDVKLRPAPSRDRLDLRHAIEAVRKAEDQLQRLEQAAEHARTKSWSAAGEVETCQQTLAKLQADEKRRLASAWIENDTVDVSPIPAATHALEQAQAELHRITSVENALASELPKAATLLSDAKRDLYVELAAYVTGSNAYSDLCQAHRDAWTRLRSVRAALAAVHSACHGQVPTALFEAAQRSESLSTNVGASVDQDFVDSWTRAMAALEKDPDGAQLPSI
jgi:hypothetical protein